MYTKGKTLHEMVLESQRFEYRSIGIRNYIKERVSNILQQMKNEGKDHERQTLYEVKLETQTLLAAIEDRLNEISK